MEMAQLRQQWEVKKELLNFCFSINLIPLFESTVKLQITLLSPSDRAKRDKDKSIKSMNYTLNDDTLFNATFSKEIYLFLYR